MARFRPEFRRIIEQSTQYPRYDEHGQVIHLSFDERIEIGRKAFFDFEYPIFDEAYKQVIETKIIKRFYMREIGYETAGLFKLMMNNWLNEYMPYYNQLYKSELIKYDPLANVGYQDKYSRTNDSNRDSTGNLTNTLKATGTSHEEGVGKSTTDTTSNTDTTDKLTSDTTSDTDTTGSSKSNTTDTTHSEGTENKREINDETPQSRLENTDQYANSVSTTNANNSNDDNSESVNSTDTTGSNKNVSHGEQDSVGSSKTVGHAETSTTTTDDINTTSDSNQNQDTKANEKFQNTEDYIFNRVGKTSEQSYAKMITEFRETFLNIDHDIIDQMDGQLFSQIYL